MTFFVYEIIKKTAMIVFTMYFIIQWVVVIGDAGVCFLQEITISYQALTDLIIELIERDISLGETKEHWSTETHVVNRLVNVYVIDIPQNHWYNYVFDKRIFNQIPRYVISEKKQ